MDARARGGDSDEWRLFDHEPVVGDRYSYAEYASQYPRQADYPVTPAGIQRNFQMTILEVLVPFPELRKTTRTRDCSDEQRFSYFMAAGINSGDAVRALGKRLRWARRLRWVRSQPVTYDLACRAQVDSKYQRDGGRTNQGITETLFPLVGAQVLYNKTWPHPGNVRETFDHVETFLRNTRPGDVVAVCDMAEVAARQSASDTIPPRIAAPTVYDYYRIRDARGGEPLLDNFPLALRVVEEVLSTRGPLPRQAELGDVIATACRRACSNPPDSYAPGQLPDVTAAVLYILFSHFGDYEILF